MPELHARVDDRVLTALEALARSSGAPVDTAAFRAADLNHDPTADLDRAEH